MIPFFLLVALPFQLATTSAAAAATATAASSPPLTASDIMARVAANQDKGEKLRSDYVYHQRIHIVSRKTNGKLMREETAEYEVLPTPNGTKKELKQIAGRYWHKGKYLEFQGDPRPEADSLDGDLVGDFREDITNEKSKDALANDLFPLTSEEQRKYEFKLLDEQILEGHQVYRIGFRPKEKQEFTWAGEALIDASDFEPVRVYTKLSRRIPFAVRTLLGTDLPGLGFNVQYARQQDGVWFPTSFGTEFRLHVLFFLNRQISVSLENRAFQHTHVESRIKSVEPQ